MGEAQFEFLRRTEGPGYLWEAGYLGNDEDCLEFCQGTVDCPTCGRFLPAGDVSRTRRYNEHGYYVRDEAAPVAHVDHGGKPCMGGQWRAVPGTIILSVEEAAAIERLDRQVWPECRACGLDKNWCECGSYVPAQTYTWLGVDGVPLPWINEDDDA